MTSSFARGLACATSILVLACTNQPDAQPPPSGDGKPVAAEGKSAANEPSKQPLALEGRVFLSQRVTEGGAPRALVPDTQLSLSFHEDARISASAGCNSLHGGYATTGGKLALTDSSITEMACMDRLDQEAWYMGFLGSSPAITIDGDKLVLEGAGTRIEYADRKVVTPDRELVGPTWTVDTIVAGDTAQHAAWPKPATLSFAPDGKLKVDAGCNGGMGTYRVAGKELTFEGVGLTEMACADPLARELEAAVAGLLHGPQPVTWEITAERLSLRGKAGGLDLVASGG